MPRKWSRTEPPIRREITASVHGRYTACTGKMSTCIRAWGLRLDQTYVITSIRAPEKKLLVIENRKDMVRRRIAEVRSM